MSTPGSQPNPYSQHNPYQQPATGSPNPYSQSPGYPNSPYGSGPSASSPGTGGQGGGKGWLWAVLGAVGASVVWAGGLFATGVLPGDDDSADLAGNHYYSDPCEAAELTSTDDHYKVESPSDNSYQGYAFEGDNLDQSACVKRLTPNSQQSSGYSTTQLTVTMSWHKKSDPTEEFADEWNSYSDRGYGDINYTVTRTTGLGDEAFVVTQEDDKNGLRWATVAVREGWVVQVLDWSSYSSRSSEEAGHPAKDTLVEMLKSDARESLKNLKKPNDGNNRRDPGRGDV
ncbi:hypothetical protein [Streptomyces sp. NPDC005438]|uniref:hypothetical protein n=1 Tax=Streptomyces sp. NPDC005438 TaxID=3156880 RepID=UPI0033B3EF08